MRHLSLHRARSNSTLRATDTTLDASPTVPVFDLPVDVSEHSTRKLRKSKSSPKLGQPMATRPTTPNTEPVPTLPASSKSNGRISEFASKFRFFKARRTDSASGIFDGLPPPSSPSKLFAKLATSNSSVLATKSSIANPEPRALHHPLRLGSNKASKATTIAQAHARHHRANTAPSSSGSGKREAALVGLGVMDLRFDVKTGKYGFPSNAVSPGACDMERSRSSSGMSSTGDSGGPGTPTDLIPSLPVSGDLGKTLTRASIDEAGCQEVIGVLGSLFVGRDDEVAQLPRPSVDVPIAEGCSPSLRPVDSSSRIPPTHHRRTSISGITSGMPVARHILPSRTSPLRGGKFDSHDCTVPLAVEEV